MTSGNTNDIQKTSKKSGYNKKEPEEKEKGEEESYQILINNESTMILITKDIWKTSADI